MTADEKTFVEVQKTRAQLEESRSLPDGTWKHDAFICANAHLSDHEKLCALFGRLGAMVGVVNRSPYPMTIETIALRRYDLRQSLVLLLAEGFAWAQQLQDERR